jgi:hypothetical protein
MIGSAIYEELFAGHLVCLFVLTRPGMDAYPIYFLDPFPDCIISTECYMSIDFHRPRASCWVWIRTIEGSHKITRRPSTSRPPGPHLSSQPARQSVQSKFDTWGYVGHLVYVDIYIVKLEKWDVISKEMVFDLVMSWYFAAIIVSHERKLINLRAQSMLKNNIKIR